MSKRTFTVTENLRRVTCYEVDEADLTPQMIELLDEVGWEGDDVDDEYLVDSLVTAAGDFENGEVIDIYLTDVPEFFVADQTNEES